VFTARYAQSLYTGIHKRMVRFRKLTRNFSHLTRAQRTPSAAATVQVSHALPAFRFSCLLRGRGASFQDGVAAGEGILCALPWPPRSPDLTPCDFFLWGFVKDSVYVPPLPMSLTELRDRITHSLQTITAGMLHRVRDEFDYRVNVCRVTLGAHIEGLWLTHEKLGHLPLLTVYVLPV
jgi:hypothetical protein